jgi:hypothetical protein
MLYELKRSPRQSPPQRRSSVFGFGFVPQHLSLASAEAGVAEDTRAADRLGRLEFAGLAYPASGYAPVGGEEDASADVRTLWTAPLTEAAFDGGPPFAHSPAGPHGNQRFAGSRRITVTEQFPSIVVRLK